MKKIVPFFFLLLTLAFSNQRSAAQVVMIPDSVNMQANYAFEVYYSMQNGIVKFTPRDQWDISFRAKILSASIIINDGTNVVLYTYPNSDTTGWASVDTAGISGWTPMYNDPENWDNGAFNRNSGGHPDYGWGRYNESTHNIIGDSLYVIKLRNGSFKKLWIQKKMSAADTWYFRYANLDGTDENFVVKDLSTLQSYDFIGYNMQTDLWAQYQPLYDRWDILFTKYKGMNNGQPYTVTGVLSNDSIRVNSFHPVPLDYLNWSAAPWDSTRSRIGYDWKTLNSTNQYEIVDSLVYFVKNHQGSVYKLYFTKFEGVSTGKITFMKGKIPGVGISDPVSGEVAVTLYPNPASDVINVAFRSPLQGDAVITLSGMVGKTLSKVQVPSGTLNYSINSSSLPSGLYFITVSGANGTGTYKVLIVR